LPHGLHFPFNFGFVPNTVAPDGDPTDVLMILDEPLFPSCRAVCRGLGVVQAQQTENNRTTRTDRIVAVPIKDTVTPSTIADLACDFSDDVERFFVTYQKAEGNRFKVLGVAGIQEALELVGQRRDRH
jgi:inorganic pyrophosphatase